MPQELHVVKCFNCETFQVDIVKKIPKWTCKLCGEKQSVKKIYGKGNGKDCRLFVQSLNEKRLLSTPTTETVVRAPQVNVQNSRGKISKWSEFIDDPNRPEEADPAKKEAVAERVNENCQTLSGENRNLFEDSETDFDSVLQL